MGIDFLNGGKFVFIVSWLNLFIRLSGFNSVELIKMVEMVGWIVLVQLVGLV